MRLDKQAVLVVQAQVQLTSAAPAEPEELVLWVAVA
jgi:hypothetical protein